MIKRLVIYILLCMPSVVLTRTNLISDDPCTGLDHLIVSIEGGEVQCGSFRDLESVDDKKAPVIRYPGAREDKLYLVLMFDPDECGTKLHYLVANVKGKDLIKGDLSKGYSMAAYLYPSPPPSSSPRRYFIYAFEQYIVTNQPVFASRCRFDVNKFVSDDSLHKKAFNMFRIKM